MSIQRYRLELYDSEAGCEMVKDSAGDLCEWEDVELLTKKLAGLEDIDEISAGYRDLCKKIIDWIYDDSSNISAEELEKEFDEVGK